MPTDIAAILLVPADGDPLGLLADGVCGARPPMAACGRLCGHASHRRWAPLPEIEGRNCYMCGYVALALALAWDGVMAPHAAGWVPHHWPQARPRIVLLMGSAKTALTSDPQKAAAYLRELFRELGTIVLLDSNGREVTP